MSVRRRTVLGLLLAVYPAWQAAQGVGAAKVYRIGWLSASLIAAQRVRIAKLALDQRIPAISPFDIVTQAGVLLSYASRLVDDLRRLPHYVDRILRGAKPADLPVEQPTRFYLAVNLGTAAAIGLVVPPSTLARADQVFQ